MVGARVLLGASGGEPFVYSGTTILREKEGGRLGSFAVSGLEEQRECMELIATWSYFVDQVRPKMGEDKSHKLMSIVFEAAVAPGGILRTQVAAGLCNLFISAALGDEAAHREILRLCDTSEQKRDVVTAEAFRRFLALTTGR
jgi:hypothetical protein